MRVAVLVALALLVLPAGVAQAGSPWSSMRHDRRNTGASPIVARYGGDAPWAFATGKGIFSTPVIGADGTVYVGSADNSFYAVDRHGARRWRFRTGGIIDSAATIGRYDRSLRTTPVTFGSGDERLYRVRTDPGPLSRRARTIWKARATRAPATGQLVNWWEGNVVTGPGGIVLAGNTGGGAYAFEADGRLRWAFQTGNSVWTAPAIARDGTSYWGSLDLSVYALDAQGRRRWSVPTLGFVTSSPALSRDERTLYIGSFDGKLYALDAATGATRWAFQTTDHVYSSPALIERSNGTLRTIVIASTDGSVYALSPAGTLRWRYDTGDVIRSSPVVGRAPGGGRVVYVGSSNGSLYALDARTGARRWSFDTTPDDPVLRDRNDLNGSPALGRRGVYIGGEHGRLDYIPYDYCLARRDRRCTATPGEAFPRNTTSIDYVTAGGNTEHDGPRAALSPATAINARLVVRRGGRTIDAAMAGAPSAADIVQADPPFPFDAQLSGDGHFITIVPRGFLTPGRRYKLRLRGTYLAGGTPVANTVVGAKPAGTFDGTLRFRVARPLRRGAPLRTGTRRVSALNVGRLAVPLPPLLPSVNQIGFDSYDLIAGTVAASSPDARGEGTVLLWVVGARRGRDGIPAADPRGGFAFPLAGRYRDDALILSQDRLNLTFSFGPVPLRRFELRAQLDRSSAARPGASLYGEVNCIDVPTYGPVLNLTGICNPEGTLATSGTFLASRYDPRGAANQRPVGVEVSSLTLDRPTATGAGAVVAQLALAAGTRYRARDHLLSIMLVDVATGRPLSLDYQGTTTNAADASGNLIGARLTLPAGTRLPARLRAYVIADAFPLAVRSL